MHFYILLINYQPRIADISTVIFMLNRDFFQKNKRYFNYSFVQVELTSRWQTKEDKWYNKQHTMQMHDDIR